MPAMTTTALTIEVLRGAQVLPQLEAVAALRMTVFAQWPYLYQGDAGYERDYLAAYAAGASGALSTGALSGTATAVLWA